MSRTAIPCCLVDDHCDVVPFLHALWRAKKISCENLVFFHVDSHPDLVPPPASVQDLTNIATLYDLLDGEGGISEFILPLCLNNHLERIVWLHQSFCDQFPDGHLPFYLGDNCDGRACVSLEESYYYDEGLVYAKEELQFSHLIDFTSCCESSFDSSCLGEDKSTKWILDICLDYFSVCNPFIIEFERKVASSLSESPSPSLSHTVTEIVQTIQKAISLLPFRGNHSEGCNYNKTFSNRRVERIVFHQLLDEILSLTVMPSDLLLASKWLQLFVCSCRECDGVSPRSQAQIFLDLMAELSFETRQCILQSGGSASPTRPLNRLPHLSQMCS
jgi:hypothetical protein